MLRVQNLMILTWLFVAVHSADINLKPTLPTTLIKLFSLGNYLSTDNLHLY